jgi:UDP-glucuronate decarboxylase
MEKQKTILVTGGAGFIGSHLCVKYLELGHQVICVDNLQTTNGSLHNIKELFKNKNFFFRKHDVIQPLLCKQKIDWIFNFACSGSYTSYQYNPVHTMKTNVVGMINLLKLAQEHGARIMQASTSEIYGDPEVTPQTESYHGNVNPLGPRACYDEGKRAAETLCMDYHREYGTDVKIIRIFNTYGPNMDPNDGRAVTNFIMSALDGKDIVIYGDGSYTRSFQYVDDLLGGIDRMMATDGFHGPVNLGNPNEITIKELAERTIALTRSSSLITYEQKATDDPKRRCPDIALAKKELEWEPKIDFTTGLRRTIDHFRMVERPEKKVLIFAATFHPHAGPAEWALEELMEEMFDTEFHIVTSKFAKGLSEEEHNGNIHIYRVGFGSVLDKYLLPIFGFAKAHKLFKKHMFVFVWSIMASYGGLAGLLLKLKKPNTYFLISLDDREVSDKDGFRPLLFRPLYRLVLRSTDAVYVSDVAADQKSSLLRDASHIAKRGGDALSFMSAVRLTYATMLNQRGSKLARPK